MSQQYFREVDPDTYFPEGHETYHSGLNRLANEWFPDSWHGEDEFRLRYQPYDASVSGESVAGRRIVLALTRTEDQMAKISDDEIAAVLAADRSEQHIAELEAPLRYRELVLKLREALIRGELSVAALADDGSDVPLLGEYWKGNLAEDVLYLSLIHI